MLLTLSYVEAREFVSKVCPVHSPHFDDMYEAVGGVPRHLRLKKAADEAVKQYDAAE